MFEREVEAAMVRLAQEEREEVAARRQRTHRMRDPVTKQWRRRKRRDPSEYLLCGLNRSECKRLAILFGVTIPPLVFYSVVEPLVYIFLACSVVACMVGLFGWWLLEEEDQLLRLYDKDGNIIFNGFGTEREIVDAMKEIDLQRNQQQQQQQQQSSSQHQPQPSLVPSSPVWKLEHSGPSFSASASDEEGGYLESSGEQHQEPFSFESARTGVPSLEIVARPRPSFIG